MSCKELNTFIGQLESAEKRYHEQVTKSFESHLHALLKDISVRYPKRAIRYVSGMGTHSVSIEGTFQGFGCMECDGDIGEWLTMSELRKSKWLSQFGETHPIVRLLILMSHAYHVGGYCIEADDVTFKEGVIVS